MMPSMSGLDVLQHNDPTTAMKAYIREHFGALLGRHVALLDEPGGLDTLALLVRSSSFVADLRE